MNLNSAPHALGSLLLAGLAILVAIPPAFASAQRVETEREQRTTQHGRLQRLDARIDADDARPAPPPRASRAPVATPQREVRIGTPAPRIIEAQPRIEPQRRDWRMPRSSDDDRHENWGELARRQQARRQAVEQQRDFEMREQQRQRIEQGRAEQQQRIEQLRNARQPRNDETRKPNSLQAQLIGQINAEQSDRNRPTPRPDWRDPRADDRSDRISDLQQRQRIQQQRHQRQQWQRDKDRRHANYDRHRHDLLRHRRHAQGRYYHDYWRRWQAAQLRWNRYRFDYDPFFYTPYNYRYRYGGHWYSTNRYGAELLQQAIRDGYREGWRAGRADRIDRWRFDYRGNYGWIDGSFGYPGYYVSYSDYRWYFRQGFERGYRDGYYDRYQYGRHDDDRDGAMILPAVLGLILAFTID